MDDFEIQPDSTTGFHGNRWGYDGKNSVSTFFSAVFHPSIFILTGNDDMHESSDEFEFRPDRTKGCGVTTLEKCQKLVFAQYLENGWTEFKQFLYTHYH